MFCLWSCLFLSTSHSSTIPQEIAPIIPSILKGIHTTIFAYGITGSGKTHTMQGTADQPGLIPRSAQHITNLIASRRNENLKITLKMSYLEIYNEKVCGLESQGETEDVERVL
jgi:kinesin family protein 22